MSQLTTQWILPRPPTSLTWMLPVSSRPIAGLGIHPFVDRLDSKSRMLDLRIVRVSRSKGCKQERYKVVTAIKRILQNSKGVRRLARERVSPMINHTWTLSPRPVAAWTTPGACQHDFAELAVVTMQYYAYDSQRA